MHTIKTILSDFSQIFFPHLCAGCGTDILGINAVLCIQCNDELPVTNFHLHADNPVEKIFHGRIMVKNASSFCYFTKDSLVQRLLHQLKYKGDKEIGYYAGRMIGKSLMQSQRFNTVDALIPLPLFASREKKRGYNQADILCDGISATMHIPKLNNIISRVTFTESQTHKNRVQRWQNMEGRFELKNIQAVTNKHILLVDDVITTGATLEACGHELLKADNLQLSIVTFAYTVS